MAVFKRTTTPPGPISLLFDRLHQLHLQAGEPALRQIAAGLGPGVVSHATVHNAFAGPRVPKWGYLELIVEELGGSIEEFRMLWLAARRAERGSGTATNTKPITDSEPSAPPRAWKAATILTGHHSYVSGVAFSPNGQLLATTSGDTTARLWNPYTGEQMTPPLTGHRGPIWGAAFSPTGRLLATASTDTTVRFWDPSTGLPASHFPACEHDGYVVGIAFSLDGRRLATGGGDAQVRIWDLPNGVLLQDTLTGHSDTINDIAFSPRGLIASASEDRTVRLWIGGPGAQFAPPLVHHPASVACVAFSADGRLLASGCDDGTVNVWNADTGELVVGPLHGHTGPVWGVAFHPLGLLASGSRDRTIRFWDPSTGDPIGKPLTGHTNAINNIAISPQGDILATPSDDDTARLWRPECD